jgi:hypothetical protein
MFSQRRLQACIALLKNSATELKDMQDNNIMAARFMIEIPESGLDPQRHDLEEVKSF